MRKQFLLLLPIFLGLTATSQIPALTFLSLTSPDGKNVDSLLSGFKRSGSSNVYYRDYSIHEFGDRFSGTKDREVNHVDSFCVSEGVLTLKTTASETLKHYLGVLSSYGFEKRYSGPIPEHWFPMGGDFDFDLDGQQYFMQYDMKGYDHSTGVSGTNFYGKGISTITVKKGKYVTPPIFKGHMSGEGIYVIAMSDIIFLIDSARVDTDLLRVLPRKYFKHGNGDGSLLGTYYSNASKQNGFPIEEFFLNTPSKEDPFKFRLEIQNAKVGEEYIEMFKDSGFVQKGKAQTVKEGPDSFNREIVTVNYKKEDYLIVSQAIYYSKIPIYKFSFLKKP